MSNIVIGPSSFLGKNLISEFKNINEKYFSLSYRPEKNESFSEELEKLISSKYIETIYICGGSQDSADTKDSLYDLCRSNVEMPGIICSLVKQHSNQTSIIYFGSSWQFNNQLEFEPFNLYAATKSAAENLFEHFAMDGIKICSLRLYDTYGPNDDRPKIVNLIAKAINNDECLNMSNGEQLINLVHIKDVIDAAIKSSYLIRKYNQKKLKKYSIKSNDTIQIKKIIKLYEEILSKNLDHLFNLGYYPYRSRERFELPKDDKVPDGWVPSISLNDGLKELLK
tara:strand:- start:1503 stop:2348 length:846 start_codon:yes stop_codon:yes gene_type:complete